jgi:hypothetical protein
MTYFSPLDAHTVVYNKSHLELSDERTKLILSNTTS